MSRASLSKAPAEVAAMFDDVAPRYDLTNDVLSLGQDRRWRRAVTRALGPSRGQRVLDLAAGTATSSTALAGSGATVVACDFSLGMLRAAARRLTGSPLRRPPVGAAGTVALVAGDALRLPFADGSFDAVTISFGLRNVARVDDALAELARVTRPGGRLVVCEFSHPTWGPFRTLYLNYLMRTLPAVARGLSSSPEAYVYLADSIRAWPGQAELACWIGAAGWAQIRWRNLSGGIVALHRGLRPPRC